MAGPALFVINLMHYVLGKANKRVAARARTGYADSLMFTSCRAVIHRGDCGFQLISIIGG